MQLDVYKPDQFINGKPFFYLRDFATTTAPFSWHPMDADFDIRYTDGSIKLFGGIMTVKTFYQNSSLHDVISSLLLPQPGSTRGYDPMDIIEGFLVIVIYNVNS